jgi:hypothetical protein
VSGGYFDYIQGSLGNTIETLKDLIIDEEAGYQPESICPYLHEFSKETLAEFKKGLEYVNLAKIYLQRIDWLVSDDDGEDSFHERLKDDLNEYCNSVIKESK